MKKATRVVPSKVARAVAAAANRGDNQPKNGDAKDVVVVPSKSTKRVVSTAGRSGRWWEASTAPTPNSAASVKTFSGFLLANGTTVATLRPNNRVLFRRFSADESWGLKLRFEKESDFVYFSLQAPPVNASAQHTASFVTAPQKGTIVSIDGEELDAGKMTRNDIVSCLASNARCFEIEYDEQSNSTVEGAVETSNDGAVDSVVTAKGNEGSEKGTGAKKKTTQIKKKSSVKATIGKKLARKKITGEKPSSPAGTTEQLTPEPAPSSPSVVSKKPVVKKAAIKATRGKKLAAKPTPVVTAEQPMPELHPAPSSSAVHAPVVAPGSDVVTSNAAAGGVVDTPSASTVDVTVTGTPPAAVDQNVPDTTEDNGNKETLQSVDVPVANAGATDAQANGNKETLEDAKVPAANIGATDTTQDNGNMDTLPSIDVAAGNKESISVLEI